MISIIIPIYNAAKYLNECLNSILKQTIDNFEVIMVDDGSTDNSSAICNNYVNKDSRFKYFYKSNSGVSSTRNLGVEKASGEYICFVDSDDILTFDYLETFSKSLNDNDNGLVCCTLHEFKENNELSVNQSSESKVVYSNENKYEILYTETAGYIFNKIYNRKIIIENNIRFSENIFMCEDTIFNAEYLKYCSKAILITKKNYLYRMYNTSSSKKLTNPRWFTIFDALITLNEYYNDFNLNTKKNYIYFCKNSMLEGVIRRKAMNNLNVSDNSDKLKEIIQSKKEKIKLKYSLKLLAKKILYTMFPKVMIVFKTKKG